MCNFELRSRLQEVIDQLLAAVERLAANGVHDPGVLAALASAKAIAMHPELLPVDGVQKEISSPEWAALGVVPRRSGSASELCAEKAGHFRTR